MNLKRQFAVVKMGDFVRFPPSRVHDSYKEACEEAERLTRKERTSFYVWELVSAVCPEAIPVKWYHVPERVAKIDGPIVGESADMMIVDDPCPEPDFEQLFKGKCPKHGLGGRKDLDPDNG